MENKFFGYINKLFIIFFFPSFVTGIFLPNLICGLFILINLSLNIRKIINLFFIYKVPSFCFIFFYFVIIISSLISQYISHSLESSALYFLYIIYIFAIIILFSDNIKFRGLFFLCGISTCFILSIDAFYEFFNGSNILGYYSIEGRIAGLFGDRWVIGRYLVYILPILIGIYFLDIEYLKKYKIYFYTTLIFSGLTIIFSGERAAFLMFFLYLFLICLYLFNKLNLYKLFIIFIFIIILFIFPFLFMDTGTRLKSNFILYLTSTDYNQNQYLSIFNTAWNMFIENPIFGIGPNNFRYACSEEIFYISKWSCTTHPHSITFQVLAEIGILGFLCTFSVLSYFIYKSLRLITSKILSYETFGIYSLQCCLIIYLFPFMITGNFFLSWYNFIYYLPIALFMVYLNKLK